MRSDEIAKKYNIPVKDFERFIYDNQIKHKVSRNFYEINDSIVEETVRSFRYLVGSINETNEALSKILITSGFNFDGYKVVKYSGYISGDDAVKIPRGNIISNADNGKNLTDALVKIRRVALQELKQAADDLGCNAVIGVDFDYITLEPEKAGLGGATIYEPYVICVTANGNAVVIEKE